IAKSRSAWLSFMLYVGCLTFTEQTPEKLLQIPNSVAAQCFGEAVLDHYRLSNIDITNTLKQLVFMGDISILLGYYKKLMCKNNVSESNLKNKTEENHCDSICLCCVFLRNLLLVQVAPEFEITQPSKIPGQIDMLIKTQGTKRVIISE
ncbi:11602_t:CDS:1, partial [Paraglomus brasilianum]